MSEEQIIDFKAKLTKALNDLDIVTYFDFKLLFEFPEI